MKYDVYIYNIYLHEYIDGDDDDDDDASDDPGDESEMICDVYIYDIYTYMSI